VYIIKYLVHWEMKSADNEKILSLLPEDLEYCKSLMKEGKLLESVVLSGKAEGFELFDVDSHEEIHEIIADAPFGPFLEFEVWPVVDFEFSLNKLKEVLEKYSS